MIRPEDIFRVDFNRFHYGEATANTGEIFRKILELGGAVVNSYKFCNLEYRYNSGKFENVSIYVIANISFMGYENKWINFSFHNDVRSYEMPYCGCNTCRPFDKITTFTSISNYDIEKRYLLDQKNFDPIYIKFYILSRLFYGGNLTKDDFELNLEKKNLHPTECFNDMIENPDKYDELYKVIIDEFDKTNVFYDDADFIKLLYSNFSTNDVNYYNYGFVGNLLDMIIFVHEKTGKQFEMSKLSNIIERHIEFVPEIIEHVKKEYLDFDLILTIINHEKKENMDIEEIIEVYNIMINEMRNKMHNLKYYIDNEWSIKYDIGLYLYFEKILNVDPMNPEYEEIIKIFKYGNDRMDIYEPLFDIRNVKKEDITYDMCIDTIIYFSCVSIYSDNFRNVLNYIPEKIITTELVMIYVLRGGCLKNIPEKYRTSDVYMYTVIHDNYCDLNKIPKEHINMELCKYAVENGKSIDDIPIDYLNVEMYFHYLEMCEKQRNCVLIDINFENDEIYQYNYMLYVKKLLSMDFKYDRKKGYKDMYDILRTIPKCIFEKFYENADNVDYIFDRLLSYRDDKLCEEYFLPYVTLNKTHAKIIKKHISVHYLEPFEFIDKYFSNILDISDVDREKLSIITELFGKEYEYIYERYINKYCQSEELKNFAKSISLEELCKIKN